MVLNKKKASTVTSEGSFNTGGSGEIDCVETSFSSSRPTVLRRQVGAV